MKNSIIILGFFMLGLTGALLHILPSILTENDFTMPVLFALIFFVGAMVGADRETWEKIKKTNMKIFLAPLTVVVGTFTGITLFSFLIPSLSLRDSLAVGAGFGYYSLSSVIITGIRGEVLGVIALASNIARELFTLIAAPLLAKYLGKLAPVVSGGATAMDTTLPVITKFSGKEYAIIAMFSGFILTILVPILVTFILKL